MIHPLTWFRAATLAALLASAAAAQNIVVETSFPLAKPAPDAIANLDGYYQVQLGKTVRDVIAEVAPGLYLENWHQIWIAVADGHATLRRRSESGMARVSKGWILEIAGQLGNETVLSFRELPAWPAASAFAYLGPHELEARVAGLIPDLRRLPSPERTALFAAPPSTLIELRAPTSYEPARLSITTAAPADAERWAAQLSQPPARCICMVVNETAALDEEIRAQAEKDELAARIKAEGVLSSIGAGLKPYENRLRARPAMRARIAATQDSYLVRYRMDRAYPKLTLHWTIAGTNAELAVTNISPAVRTTGEKPAEVHIRIPQLEPGEYRLRLTAGAVSLSERTFRFDGKLFEEI